MIKKIMLMTLLGCSVISLCAAKGKSEKNAGNIADGETSYAFGLTAGEDISRAGFDVDYDAFMQGLRDSLEHRKARFDSQEAAEKIQIAIISARVNQAEKHKQESGAFLAANGKKWGITTTPSGLQYEVLARGKGAKPGLNDTVTVNYEGSFIDGRVFESSYTAGAPVQFRLTEVIRGWTEGLQLMNEGGTYRFYIAPELAYGERGGGERIPPNTVLIFKLELLAIKK
jgi:FKBP-type peptidyl-prolyl cis-trans isomerase